MEDLSKERRIVHTIEALIKRKEKAEKENDHK